MSCKKIEGNNLGDLSLFDGVTFKEVVYEIG